MAACLCLFDAGAGACWPRFGGRCGTAPASAALGSGQRLCGGLHAQVAAAFAALPATAAQRAVVAQHCPGLLQHLLVSGEGVLPAAKRRLVREALAMVPALNESQAARRRGVHARAEGARSRRRQLQAVRAWRMRRPRKPPAGAEGAEGTPAAALVAPTPAGAR